MLYIMFPEFVYLTAVSRSLLNTFTLFSQLTPLVTAHLLFTGALILRGRQENGSEMFSKHFPYEWSLFCSSLPRLERHVLEITSLSSRW